MFTSKYVYKIKRSASTGEAYRFKARMIVRGFEMEKGPRGRAKYTLGVILLKFEGRQHI